MMPAYKVPRVRAKRSTVPTDWRTYKPTVHAADMQETAEAKALRIAFLSGRLRAS
jgi:hypothetical protein